MIKGGIYDLNLASKHTFPHREVKFFIKKKFQIDFSIKFLILIVVEAVLAIGLFIYLSKGTLTISYLGLGLFFVLIYHHPVFAYDEWQKTYETSYATICYPDDKELYSFTGAIKRGFSIFSDNPEKNQSLTKERVDMIVDRVSRILDMFPPDLHFSIYLYPTHREIERIYLRIGASHIFEKTPIAFYSHKARAIYVSIENITGGVLAHEIAHAVINFHFRTPPPEKMQEILAQYVDKHLWEE